MKMHDIQVCTFYTRVSGESGDTQYLRRFQSGQWEIFTDGAWRLIKEEFCKKLEYERDLYTQPNMQPHEDHLPVRDDERRS